MFFFKGRFSLHSSDCSTTYYVAQTGLEFRDLPASGIKGCIIMHNLHPLFSQCFKSHLPLLEAPSLVPDSNFLLEMDNGNKSHRPIAPKKVFQRWRGTGQVVLSCRSHLSTRGPQSPVLREASVTTALDKVHTPLTGHQASPGPTPGSTLRLANLSPRARKTTWAWSLYLPGASRKSQEAEVAR